MSAHGTPSSRPSSPTIFSAQSSPCAHPCAGTTTGLNNQSCSRECGGASGGRNQIFASRPIVSGFTTSHALTSTIGKYDTAGTVVVDASVASGAPRRLRPQLLVLPGHQLRLGRGTGLDLPALGRDGQVGDSDAYATVASAAPAARASTFCCRFQCFSPAWRARRLS